MRQVLSNLIETHAGKIAWTGAMFGWLSVDLLRAAQFFAALMAGLVSVLAFIISLPKAVRILRNLRATLHEAWHGDATSGKD